MCAHCGAPWPEGLSRQGLGARKYCGPTCRRQAEKALEAERKALPPTWEQEIEAHRTALARERGISREDRALVADAGPVLSGPAPAFYTEPISHRYTADGDVLAVIARPAFDGTQSCAGDDRFITDDALQSSLVRRDLTRVCASCPFFRECYDWSIAHERHGFLAGMTGRDLPRERQIQGVRLVERTCADLYGLPVTTGGEAA